MKKFQVVLFSLLIAVCASPVLGETQAQLQKEAKISMKKARSIALKKAPGKISSAELERENGKLIYSFDIKKSGQTGVTEVAVDAISGEVVDVHHETPAKEAAEKKKEATEKSPTKHR
ncbi:MAG TPA: PepSY domain-containing protein [Thermoanaerobaculia bacterium]|nr:PepSY domain-containing protein [Thermoanaerobaculia bacterium]